MISPEQLAGAAPFNRLAAAHLSLVATTAREVTFPAGATIFTEGQLASGCWLIGSGQVALGTHVPGRGQVVVRTLGPGDLLGWSWLVPPHRWRFDARAVKPSRAIALDAEVLRRTLRSHPTWGFQFMVRFMPVLAERLENTRVQLLDIHAR